MLFKVSKTMDFAKENKKSSTARPRLRQEGQREVILVICGWWQLAGARRREQKEGCSVKDRTKRGIDYIFGMMEHLFCTWGPEEPHRSQ